MLLEWLPFQVSWALSLLRASCLNHLFSLPICRTATSKDICRQLHQSAPDCLPDRPPPLLMQPTKKRAPHHFHPSSSLPVLFFSPSSSKGFKLLYYFLTEISSPPQPTPSVAWYLFKVTVFRLCKDMDSAPSIPRLLFPASLNPSILPFVLMWA